MIKLDNNLLDEIGLGGLPQPEKQPFLNHMYETLEMRVGTRLAQRMTEQQMTEFEAFVNGGDEQGAFQWLESNFPDYKQVVAEEFDKLKGEIVPLAPQILAAAQDQSDVQAPQAPPIQAGVPTGQDNGPVPAADQQAYGPAPADASFQPAPQTASEPLPPQSPHHGNQYAQPAAQQSMQPQPNAQQPAAPAGDYGQPYAAQPPQGQPQYPQQGPGGYPPQQPQQ